MSVLCSRRNGSGLEGALAFFLLVMSFHTWIRAESKCFSAHWYKHQSGILGTRSCRDNYACVHLVIHGVLCSADRFVLFVSLRLPFRQLHRELYCQEERLQ